MLHEGSDIVLYLIKMPKPRRLPRRDPLRLFQIQADFAAGLAATDIAVKHELPVPAVLQIVRSQRHQGGLVDPFQLTHGNGPTQLHGTTQMYWLGYIAACGRLYQQGPAPTLVLDVDRRDVAHVEAMVEDLCTGRPSCEFCESSRNGLQAYVRDRDLGHLLTQWGVPGADPVEGSVPISLIPSALFSHFLRGYLEGGHRTPPFGGKTSPASVPAIRTVAFIGPLEFVTALSEALRKHLGTRAGNTSARRDGLHTLTYRGSPAKQVVQFAYRNVTRSLPRAAKLVHSIHPRLNHLESTPATRLR